MNRYFDIGYSWRLLRGCHAHCWRVAHVGCRAARKPDEKLK